MPRKDPFETARPATMEEVLDAREQRAATQRELLNKWKTPLICFTMNTPGEHKAFPLARQGYETGKSALRQQLSANGIAVLHCQEDIGAAGYTCFLLAAGRASVVKAATMALEDTHPLGRLFDMDVFDVDGTALHGEEYGRKQRTCLICGKPVWECSRNRRHSAESLAARYAEILQEYYDGLYADEIAGKAARALLTEVCITPKPGLVDRADNGAHRDMDMFTFIGSACALIPYFGKLTRAAIRFKGAPHEALGAMRYLGVIAENDMYKATGGINTHKGAIFSLGLICIAVGLLYREGESVDADAVLNRCALLAGGVEAELKRPQAAQTHGMAAYQRHGLSGVRGEAARGFPSVRKYALPILRKYMGSGCSAEQAGVVALLHLIAHTEDTCMIARSSLTAVREIQRRVEAAIRRCTDYAEFLAYAKELNEQFIVDNISPGGCADLLAATLMLLSVTDDVPDGTSGTSGTSST